MSRSDGHSRSALSSASAHVLDLGVLGRAREHEHGQPPARLDAQQVPQQRGRRLVRAVEVVEHEQHAALVGDVGEQRRRPLRRAGSGAAADRPRAARSGRAQRRAVPVRAVRARAARRPARAAAGASRRARAAGGRSRRSADRARATSAPRRPARFGGPRELVAAAVQDARAVGVGVLRELRREPRLADAGVAVEQADAHAGLRAAPPAGQPCELRLTPVQGRRIAPAQRARRRFAGRPARRPARPAARRARAGRRARAPARRAASRAPRSTGRAAGHRS